MTIVQNFSTDSILKNQIDKIYTDFEVSQTLEEINLHTLLLKKLELGLKNYPSLLSLEKALSKAKKCYFNAVKIVDKQELKTLNILKNFTNLIQKLDKLVNNLFIKQLRAEVGIL